MEQLFSVIYKGKVEEAFEKVLNYYLPNNKFKNLKVIDSTASEMKMWSKELKEKYKPISVDIDKNKNPDVNCSCTELDNYFKEKSIDCIIYDPPYIDLNKRKDTANTQQAKDIEEVAMLVGQMKRGILKAEDVTKALEKIARQ